MLSFLITTQKPLRRPGSPMTRSILILFSMPSLSTVGVLSRAVTTSCGHDARHISLLCDAAAILSASDARTARSGLPT